MRPAGKTPRRGDALAFAAGGGLVIALIATHLGCLAILLGGAVWIVVAVLRATGVL